MKSAIALAAVLVIALPVGLAAQNLRKSSGGNDVGTGHTITMPDAVKWESRSAFHAAWITDGRHAGRPNQEGSLYHPRQVAGRLHNSAALAQRRRKRHRVIRNV